MVIFILTRPRCAISLRCPCDVGVASMRSLRAV